MHGLITHVRGKLTRLAMMIAVCLACLRAEG